MSSFWGIVFYIRKIKSLGLTTQKNATHMPFLAWLAGFLFGSQGVSQEGSGRMVCLLSSILFGDTMVPITE